jgi:hypothetical protein
MTGGFMVFRGCHALGGAVFKDLNSKLLAYVRKSYRLLFGLFFRQLAESDGGRRSRGWCNSGGEKPYVRGAGQAVIGGKGWGNPFVGKADIGENSFGDCACVGRSPFR